MAENLEEYKDLDNLLETPDPLEAGRGDALDEELTKGDDSTIEGVLNEEDSNLSSFLEDLSTIDDLDDDPLEAVAPQAAAATKAARTRKKQRWPRRLLWLLLLGGGGVAFYLFAWPSLRSYVFEYGGTAWQAVQTWWEERSQPEPDPFAALDEDRPSAPLLPGILTPSARPVPSLLPSPVPPSPPVARPQVRTAKIVPPAKKPPRSAKPIVQLPPLPEQLPRLRPRPRQVAQGPSYGIQLAACLSQQCVRHFTQLAERIGDPVLRQKRSEVQESIELVSRSAYQDRETAEELSGRINYEHRLGGHASVQRHPRGGYQITLGFFGDLNEANHVKTYLNQRFGAQAVFTTQLSRQGYDLQTIAAGRFATRPDAEEALAILQASDPAYAGAMIIRNPAL